MPQTILIINGSPRRKGLISQMLDIMQQETEQQWYTVHTTLTETDEQKCRKAMKSLCQRLRRAKG